MNRLAPMVLSVGLLVGAACGGDSASSDVSMRVPSSSTAVPATTDAPSPSTEGASTEPSTAPVELLVDASYDIEAIEGPVVLWFWAPG